MARGALGFEGRPEIALGGGGSKTLRPAGERGLVTGSANGAEARKQCS